MKEVIPEGNASRLEPLRVLIVEDSVEDTFFVVRELQRGGFQVDFERVETAPAMQEALDNQTWDLVISDYSLPQFGGAAALAIFRQRAVDVPFILVSGTLGEEIAVEMLKSGAHDYVMKDHLDRLVPAVRHELRAAQERRISRQTEAASNYLALLVKSCQDAIIGEALDGTIVSWNSGAERLYGYSAVEIVGRSISVLMPSYRPDEMAELMERIKRGETVDRYETVRLRKDGTPVDVSLTLSPIRDLSGRIIGASALTQDITEQKRQENDRLALIQDLTSALARVNGGAVP